ncbi:MAG: uracil-DNA glycosylase [Eubacteriales bacterium]|nr:uracil-DNA glycosylase [Eubacteriales bacterium]
MEFIDIINEEKEKEYFKNLQKFLDIEYKTNTIFPKREEIFRAFELTPLNNIKIVILGQDPYHERDEAHGLAFSVLKGEKIPPSLKNIFKELKNDLNINMEDGFLEEWAKNGVLLMNTILTVREGIPLSHKNIGWEIFTKRILVEINKLNKKIVFMLWGNNAKEYKNLITNKNFLILESPHPSPLSASRGFFGCKHFSKAQEFLNCNIFK